MNSLLDGLDESQNNAVTAQSVPLAILAGAGAGKTRVLTRRIAWQSHQKNIDPERVLAVTFTRRAAGELVERLSLLGIGRSVTAGTFHGLALAQIHRHASDAGRNLPKVLDRKTRLLIPLLGPSKGPETVRDAGEVGREIEWAKARLVAPKDFEEAAAKACRHTSRPLGELSELYDRYEKSKRSKGLLDFEDLVIDAASALEANPELAAIEQWRYRHLFVDEFQDLSPAQYRLVRAWMGASTDLVAVGDPDQAIYSFAGADPSYLCEFGRHFPGAEVVSLACNYRSTPSIIELSHRALVNPTRTRPQLPPSTSTSNSSELVNPGLAPVLVSYESERDEAEAIAAELIRARDAGRSWSELAVLFRTNAQCALIEAACAAKGVPTRTIQDPDEDQVTSSFNSSAGSPSSNAVDLATFHRSKGLEWDVVFMAGLEEGYVPIFHAQSPAAIAEEHRLVYVALSRARDELHISWCESRTFGARSRPRRPSAILARLAIDATLGTAKTQVIKTPKPASEMGLSPIRRARMALAGSAGLSLETREADAALTSALKSWRSATARACAIPAYIVFADATLAEVASSRPRCIDDLLKVSGIGPAKSERYGDSILEIVRSHTESEPALR